MTGNKHRKVYIEHSNNQYERMFVERGWKVVINPLNADMIQFTGGADVSPILYHRGSHPTTWTNMERDARETALFDFAQEHNIPCAGICRGSQFLHVMAGGELVQDCDNHAVRRGHMAEVSWMPGELLVSSTHHQMMASTEVGELLLWAENLATYKQTMTAQGGVVNLATGIDIEGMYYDHINCLSFQPHPEFSVDDKQYEECADAYFFMIENYLFGEK